MKILKRVCRRNNPERFIHDITFTQFSLAGGTVKGINNALDYHDRKISMLTWDKEFKTF